MLIDTNAESVVRTLKSEKQQAECTAARAVPIVFPRGRPFGAPAGTYSRPVDTPTPRRGAGGRAESPLLASINDNFAVSNSPWRGLTRRYRREGRACSPMGRSIVRVAIRRGLGRAESPQCARRRNPQPPVGLDAPTPARIGTGRPKGRSHFSFGGERKVYKRKPAARQLLRPAPLRTAAKPCATLVLGYALHGLRPFRALVGLRPPLVAGFGLR